MTQKPETQEQELPEAEFETPMPRPGDILRAAREAKKLTTSDVAARLRLRKQLVEEIEDNKFDPKVAGTFTRGYLRAYAKLLEVPEEDVLAAYYELGLEAPRKDAMQSFSRRTKQQTADNRLMILTYVIAAVILASVVLFAWQQANDEDKRAAQIPQRSIEIDPAEAFSDEAQADPTPANEWVAETTSEATAEPTVSPQVQEQEPGPEPEPEPEPAVTETQITEEPPQAEVDQVAVEATPPPSASIDNASIDDVDPTAGDLVFYFRGDCWVRIDDATGENIAGGVKRTGYIMPLNGEAPYSIQLGAPDLVEMWYRGERVDMSQFRQGRVARFTWPVSG